MQWGLQLAPAGPVSVFVIMSKSSSARSDGLDTAGGGGSEQCTCMCQSREGLHPGTHEPF